jgi:diguanylate cyclase (GGDEF)-like protein
LELAQREYERARRYQRTLSALMIDLDHFKRVNDTYGHPIGDQVLAALADCCLKDLRPSDLFGRYGGEEFLVLLPETDHTQALEVAERLRKKVEKILLDTPRGPVNITVSVGVATLAKETDLDLDRLIIQADDALYAAKAAGRNQVGG